MTSNFQPVDPAEPDVNNGVAMRMYQIIFQSGRVGNLMADGWSKKHDRVRFQVGGKETNSFPAGDLIMIDDLETESGRNSGRKRLAESSAPSRRD
jgi:hypothetical protein